MEKRQKALDLLGLLPDTIYSYDYIRKAYYKMALKYHPDKYGDGGEKFREIKQAYELLKEPQEEKEYTDNTKTSYNDYLLYIIQQLELHNTSKCANHPINWNSTFISTTFISILNSCEDMVITVFDTMTKDKSKECYYFLLKYGDIFGISEEVLKKIKSKIIDKMKYDNIIILNPSLHNLFNHDIYKLEIDNDCYYVPLWHHELYFNTNNVDREIIVKCIPELPNNIYIDDENNIHYKINKKLNDILMENTIDINLCNETNSNDNIIRIYVKELKITHEPQIFIFKYRGIPLINTEHIYDIKKGNIYIEITLNK